MGKLAPKIIVGDWNSVAHAIAKLDFALNSGSAPTFASLTLADLTASRLVATDASKVLASADLVSWIAGTANQVAVADDGDGTVTLSTPQDIHTSASPTFDGGTFTSVVTGILPTSGDHLVTKEYVDLAIGSVLDFFLSDTPDGVVADTFVMYEKETGEAQSTDVTAALAQAPDQLIFTWLSETGRPAASHAREGVYDMHVHLTKSGTKSVGVYWTLSFVDANGSSNETLIVTSEVSDELTTSDVAYDIHAVLANDTTTGATKRLLLQVYANVTSSGSPTTVTVTMEGTTDSHLTVDVPSDVWQLRGDVLDDLNTLGPVGANSEFLVGTGAGALAWESGSTARDSLSLGTGDSPTFNALTLTSALTVPNGGTGVNALTEGGVLVGSGVGAVTALGAAGHGGLIIGSAGADPVVAPLTGTANQLIVTNAAGSITLSTPQDIHTGASPTFTSLTILTTGKINFRDTDIFIGSTLTDGILDMGADFAIDMFYDNADVGNGVDGQSLNINRRAAEGDDYISLYVDKDKKGLIGFSGDNDLLQLTANALTVNGTVTATGTLTSSDITILNTTPILIFKDSNSTGDASIGFIEWRDSDNTRLGFFGNSSSGNDDLLWKNESSGGHINIQTTGVGEFQILANTVLTGTLASGVITQSGTTLANTYQPLDAGLTSLAGLTYVAASFVKMTAANVFALRTIGETADDLEGTIDHNNLANTHEANIFKNVAVAGQDTVVADSDTDTLTLVAGTNITITTVVATDTITINASGGGAADDTAYDATSWNANLDAATKNAIRDKVETMDVAIGLNTSKVTNVSTSLSIGTVNGTSYSISSDGGVDDVVIAQADTTNAGVLSAVKWDEIVANTAKVTNATHTGDVTGATALAAQSVMITGQSAVTAVGTDYVLISDTSDSGNLKKALVSDFSGGSGGGFVDRGDPATVDFSVGDFITDNTWRDLDLSSIVTDSAAVAVVLHVTMNDGAAGSRFLFRKKGNSNSRAVAGTQTQVANVVLSADFTIPCDTNQIVQYLGDNLTFTAINVTVLGWFL